MHHFDGAASETEGEGPRGVGEGPLAQIVDCHLGVLEHVVGFGGTEFVHEGCFAAFFEIDTVGPFGGTTGDDGHTSGELGAVAAEHCCCFEKII